MKHRTFAMILFFIVLSTWVSVNAQQIIDVQIKGISDGNRNTKRIDRDEAVMDAKLQAVEKAGVNIKSVTEVENFMLKKDWIQSKAEAYLMPGYEIIDVGYGEDGLYNVVLIGKIRVAAPPPAEAFETLPKPRDAVPSTPEKVSDIIDNVYKTVKIGNQVWMAVNLNVNHFRNGDRIPEAKTKEEWKYAGERGLPAWCYYDNDPANGRVYGKLYNIYAVNDPRGLAPEGWHVTSDREWDVLMDYLFGTEVAGGKLKETGTTHWQSPNHGATNESSFSALPGGYRVSDGAFYDLGVRAVFWSDAKYMSIRLLIYDSKDVTEDRESEHYGLSMRLIRDN